MAIGAPERYFNTQMPFTRFARNCLLASLAPSMLLVPIYIASTPDFWSFIVEFPAARGRLIRQLLTNGLPVVFFVNYAGFFLFATQARHGPVGARFVVFDAAMRPALFVALHVVIYAVSADLYGSFGGDRWQGVRVVFPTLAQAAFFDNLSGVYLYSVLLTAAPLYWHAFENVFRTTDYGSSDQRSWTKKSAVSLLMTVATVSILTLAFALVLVQLSHLAIGRQ